MPDYSDWEDIFQEPWDVITGAIPGNDFAGYDEPYPNDPLDQLAVVIRKSRELLEVDHISMSTFESDPEYFAVLREIFGATRSTYQYLDCYMIGGPGLTIRTFFEQVVESARSIVHEEAPGFVILAVCAIKVAFRQAQRLVQYGEATDTAKALSLLAEAERLATEEQHKSELQDIVPLAKARKQNLDTLEGNNEYRKDASLKSKEITGIWYDRINAEKPSLGRGRIAAKIFDMLHSRKTQPPDIAKLFPQEEIDQLEEEYLLNRKDSSQFPKQSTIQKWIYEVRPAKKMK